MGFAPLNPSYVAGLIVMSTLMDQMTGPRQQHVRMFALYNRWANQRLYDAAAQLTPAQLTEDRGAFFRSVLGTLNHLLVADRIWMARLRSAPPPGYRLDQMLHDNLPDLRRAREAEDQGIVAHVFALGEEDFDRDLSYATTTGVPHAQPIGQILAHVFNHQTHHRGQAHDLIGQILGREKTPVLDLLFYQRAAAATDKP